MGGVEESGMGVGGDQKKITEHLRSLSLAEIIPTRTCCGLKGAGPLLLLQVEPFCHAGTNSFDLTETVRFYGSV